jgi:hypothetical protein
MTISIFLVLMNTVLISAILIFFFRSLNLQSKMDALHFRRLNEMNDLYQQHFESLENEIADLRRKHKALPCWEKTKTEETATESKVVDDDAPRRSIHVVSVNNGSLSNILGQIFGNSQPPDFSAAHRLFNIVESDKKTAAQLVDAMKMVTDNELLDVALQGLIEREDYEYVQLVKDEIQKRKASK